MRRLRALLIRLGELFRRDRRERDFAAEMESHLQLHIGDNLRAGMNAAEARRQALIKLGGIEQTKENYRDRRGLPLLETLFQDLRFAVRLLRKNPGFAVVAVLALALSIGATTAIFSVVNAVLLRPLGMEDPSHVVYVQETWRDIFPGLSVGNFADLKRQSTSFAELCASNNASFNLEARELPERVDGEIATANYFATFGVQPIAGRVFTAEEDKPGQPKVVVISERLWRTKLHADPLIVGQPIRINGLPTTVVGIMPKSFDPLLSHSDLWIPAAYTAEKLADHDNHYLNVMARLKPGTSQAQAQSELNVIARRLQQQYPIDNEDRGFRLQPLTSALLGDQRVG